MISRWKSEFLERAAEVFKRNNPCITVKRQAELLSINRTSTYLKAIGTDKGAVPDGNAMDLFQTLGIADWLEMGEKYKNT